MANPDLGTKRLCSGCGAKFYDLNRAPILCPKCGKEFIIQETARAKSEAARSQKQKVVEDETEVGAEAENIDIVSLEEAEEEEDTPLRKVVADDDDEVDDIDTDIADSTLLENEDDDDDDVSDLIGDVDDDDS